MDATKANDILATLAHLHFKQGQFDLAVASMVGCLRSQEQSLPENDAALAYTCDSLAYFQMCTGDLDAAITNYNRYLSIMSTDPSRAVRLGVYSNMATVYERMGNLPKAYEVNSLPRNDFLLPYSNPLTHVCCSPGKLGVLKHPEANVTRKRPGYCRII